MPPVPSSLPPSYPPQRITFDPVHTAWAKARPVGAPVVVVVVHQFVEGS
jgi:hypothetical protein